MESLETRNLLLPIQTPFLTALPRFWQEAYKEYARPLSHGTGFHVPRFPGALLSPNFHQGNRRNFLQANRGLIRHFNEIVPLGHDQRGPAPAGWTLTKQFYLGEKRVTKKALPAEFWVELMPLREAIGRAHYWKLITDGFGSDAAFLRMLLPFLCTLQAAFLTAFLCKDGRRVGVVSVGIAGKIALVLNEVVGREDRGQGLSGVLSDLAQNLAFENGAEEAFFWSEHAFLGRHADTVGHYRIFELA